VNVSKIDSETPSLEYSVNWKAQRKGIGHTRTKSLPSYFSSQPLRSTTLPSVRKKERQTRKPFASPHATQKMNQSYDQEKAASTLELLASKRAKSNVSGEQLSGMNDVSGTPPENKSRETDWTCI
jgi:hypothetical protein